MDGAYDRRDEHEGIKGIKALSGMEKNRRESQAYSLRGIEALNGGIRVKERRKGRK